jgi:hypothetical protein
MVVQDRYKEFKFLKRDVIVPAMKEINEISNIQVELRTVRSGRAVTAVQFMVKPNPQMALLEIEEEDEISSTEAYKALLEQKIGKTLARSWVIEYGEEYVLDKIDLANQEAARGKIKSSKSGFLKSAIISDYHNQHAAEVERQTQVEKVKSEERQKEISLEKLRAAQKAVKRNYRDKCREMIDIASQALSEAQRGEYQREFKDSLSNSIYVENFKRYGWSDKALFPDIMAFWNTKGLTFPEAGDMVHDGTATTLSKIEQQIQELEG